MSKIWKHKSIFVCLLLVVLFGLGWLLTSEVKEEKKEEVSPKAWSGALQPGTINFDYWIDRSSLQPDTWAKTGSNLVLYKGGDSGQYDHINFDSGLNVDYGVYLSGTFTSGNDYSFNGQSITIKTKEAALGKDGSTANVWITISDISIHVNSTTVNPYIACTNANTYGSLRIGAMSRNGEGDIFGIKCKVSVEIRKGGDLCSGTVLSLYDDLDQPGYLGGVDGQYTGGTEVMREGISSISGNPTVYKGSYVTTVGNGYFGTRRSVSCEETSISFVTSTSYNFVYTGTNCATFIGTDANYLIKANPVKVKLRTQKKDGSWTGYNDVYTNSNIPVGQNFTWSWNRDTTTYPDNIYNNPEAGVIPETADSTKDLISICPPIDKTIRKATNFYFQLSRKKVKYEFDYTTYNPYTVPGLVDGATYVGNQLKDQAGHSANSFEKFVEDMSDAVGDPTLSGYVFLGFYEHVTRSADGSLSYNTPYQIEKMMEPKTFYAVWRPLEYYVYYNPNGGTNFDWWEGEFTQNTVGGSTGSTIWDDTLGWLGNVSKHQFNQPAYLAGNGYYREGYTFMGWNTAADGSGTAFPAYSSTAGGGYSSTAGSYNSKRLGSEASDNCYSNGYGTFQNWSVTDKEIKTLYAQWKKNYGTETITCISEETGNRMANVKLQLQRNVDGVWTNTGSQQTTNSLGQITMTDLHWFNYRYVMDEVPAGYYKNTETPADCYINYPSTDFTIIPCGSCGQPVCSQFSVANTVILYMKHVDITIDSSVNCIISGEDPPTFLYHIRGQDAAGIYHDYNTLVQISKSTKTGSSSVNESTRHPTIHAGTYTITQTPVSRYVPGTAVNVSHATPSGSNATVNVLNYTSAEVRFPYSLTNHGWWYGVDSKKNMLRK